MMEDHEFCDHCPGCRPAMMDAVTGQTMPEDHPTMIAASKVWDGQTTYEERKGFIEVTLHNSRKPSDLAAMQKIVDLIQVALEVKH